MTSEPNQQPDPHLDSEYFLYPMGKYEGKFTPQELAFNAHLQAFSQRVSYICGLEAKGKLSAQTAYDEIRQLVDDLKQSKQELLDDFH